MYLGLPAFETFREKMQKCSDAFSEKNFANIYRMRTKYENEAKWSRTNFSFSLETQLVSAPFKNKVTLIRVNVIKTCCNMWPVIFSQWIVNNKSWTVNNKSWTVNNKSWIVNNKSWIVNNKSWIVNNKSWTVNIILVVYRRNWVFATNSVF